MKTFFLRAAGRSVVLLVLPAMLVAVVPAVAQEEGGLTFSGFIDASYNYNLSSGTTNSLRSYDARANQILLNNIHVVASGSPSEKLSYVAEFDFGTDAAVHGLLHQTGLGATPVAVDVQEAYLVYSFSDQVTFTGGKFVTFQGIELIESPANPTISRGYLFGLAEAFTHVGGFVNIIPSGSFDIKVGVVNGWDLLVDNNPDKTIISRLGFNLGDPLAFGISHSYGVEQVNSSDARNSIDLTGVTKSIPGIALNFQVNYGTETFSGVDTKWFGFGLQPVIPLSSTIDLGLRAEYFADDQGARTGAPGLAAYNVTVVPAFKYDGITFRVEYRFDNANQEVFIKKTGTAKNSSTLSLEVFCNL
ncbi:MAG: porin [Ignavibacteriae bacterium]|nr:porin [Ignavibacteriota bacterium]